MAWTCWLLRFAHEWGDLASVLGVLVSVFGFVFTIAGVVRTKNAAQAAASAAATAAAEVRQKLSLQMAIYDVTRAAADLDEIRLFHREGYWKALPTRYSGLRRQLLAIKAHYPDLTRPQRSKLQGLSAQMSDVEQIIETALVRNQQPDVLALNRTVSEQGDKLHDLLVSIQRVIGS